MNRFAAVLSIMIGLGTSTQAYEIDPDRASIGVFCVDVSDVYEEMKAEGRELPRDRGLLVSFVTPNSPAEKAGIKKGDLIVRINRTPVRNWKEYKDQVFGMDVGKTVTVHGYGASVDQGTIIWKRGDVRVTPRSAEKM